MLYVTETPRYFEIQFDFMPRIKDEVKAIEGARWNPVGKLWLVPKNRRFEVEQLNKKYGAPVIKQRPEEYSDIPQMPEPSEDIIQWAKENLKLMPYHYQLQGIERGVDFKRFINGDEPGLGKCETLDAKIQSPHGVIFMRDIKIGDLIFSKDGSVQTVTGVFPQGKKPVYKIEFSDGSIVKCGYEHLWCVRDQNRRRRNKGWTVKPLYEIIQSGTEYKTNKKRIDSGRKPSLKWEIPMCEPVQHYSKHFNIRPYTMGALIGDACCKHAITFNIPDEKTAVIDQIKSELPESLSMNFYGRFCGVNRYRIAGTGSKNVFMDILRNFKLNVLSEDKFIPKEYMMGSVSQRKELLAGLLDTDGSCIRNRTTFHTISTRLAKDVKELVESLGGICIIRAYDRSCDNKPFEYQVNIRTNFNPFKNVGYKRNAWSVNKSFLVARYIKSIEYLGEHLTQCISVSSPDKLYLTNNFIVTHNTLQSIATVTRLNAFPALIVCPSTLKENWRREWSEKFTNKKALVMTDKIKNTWQTYLKVGVADVMIVNYESLKKYFVASIDVPPGKKLQLKYVQFKEDINLFKSVVFDEIHKCKDITTQQAKFAKGISKGKEVIIGLTGTPIVNGPKDLASQVGIINRFEVFGNYKNFQNRYCEGGNGAANLKELNYKMYSNFYFRRNKKDVLTDLPDRTRQVFLTDITTRREYDKAKNEFVKYLKEIKGCTDTDVKRKLKAQFIVQLGLLKAISARGKLDAVYEWVDEIISSGEKVILFCSLREIGNAVIQRYNKICVAVRGDVTGDARQAAIDRFQKDDDIKVIVCSIKAAGTGLTLTASSRVGFIELPWHDADCDQCESRAHRIGQKNAVLAAYFLGDKTVDLYCYDIIKNKRKIAQTVSGQEEIDEHVIDNLINLFSGHD